MDDVEKNGLHDDKAISEVAAGTAGATELSSSHQLSSAQLRAVDLVVIGCGDRDIAKQLSIDRTTVWRWRTRDPAFRAAVNARRAELWQASIDRVRSLLPLALDAVADALAAGDLHAAFRLLQLAGLSGVRLGWIGPDDAAVIVEAEEREGVQRDHERAEAEVRALEARANLAYRRAVVPPTS